MHKEEFCELLQQDKHKRGDTHNGVRLQRVDELGGDLPLVDGEPGCARVGVSCVEVEDWRPFPVSGGFPRLLHPGMTY